MLMKESNDMQTGLEVTTRALCVQTWIDLIDAETSEGARGDPQTSRQGLNLTR